MKNAINRAQLHSTLAMLGFYIAETRDDMSLLQQELRGYCRFFNSLSPSKCAFMWAKGVGG